MLLQKLGSNLLWISACLLSTQQPATQHHTLYWDSLHQDTRHARCPLCDLPTHLVPTQTSPSHHPALLPALHGMLPALAPPHPAPSPPAPGHVLPLHPPAVYCTPRSSLRRIAKFCTILTKYRTPSWDNYVKPHDQHSNVPCSGSGGTWESHVPGWPRLAYMGHMGQGGSKLGSVQTRWTPLVPAPVAPVAVSRPPSKMCPMLLQGLGVGRLCCYSCVPCPMPSYAGQCPMLLRKGDLGLTT
jgi:hypothetical protein